MKDRIKEVRKALGLSQTEFGERVGVKQTTIAGYETGAKNPMDAVITSICREFDVNETWLRYGEGKMFLELTRDQKIADFVGTVLQGESDSFKRRFVSMLAKLDESEWAFLEAKATELVEGENNRKDQP